jgi:hypothetical protein
MSLALSSNYNNDNKADKAVYMTSTNTVFKDENGQSKKPGNCPKKT